MTTQNKKCLITGCGGFIGSHLAEFLLEKGLTVYGTAHRGSENIAHLKDRLNIYTCDILDRSRLEAIVAETVPDYIFHLAAQTGVTTSWQDPEKTLRVNILGTLYLLESVRKAGIDPVIQIAGSSAEYGQTAGDNAPIKEDRRLAPSSPYGVSKSAEDMLSHLYWRSYGLRIIRVRPFLIIGPRKTPDACSDFARGIAEIEAGQRDVLKVGNLSPVRDFVDVRDAVRAMWLLMGKGTPGEVYNICSGKGHRIKDILDRLLSLSIKTVSVYDDPGAMRPYDEPVLIGDNSRLSRLGWRPRFDIDKTLGDTLDYWRARTRRKM
jgi:GDP-4-dehydro-6-deoxy-D-mannose reductase